MNFEEVPYEYPSKHELAHRVIYLQKKSKDRYCWYNSETKKWVLNKSNATIFQSIEDAEKVKDRFHKSISPVFIGEG